MSGKYIIGCGISGLIYAYYNPDFQIISTDIGGKLQYDWMSSTVLLHDTEAMRQLLGSLNLIAKPEAHIIKYSCKGKLISEPQKKILNRVAYKKFTLYSSLPKLDTSILPPEDRPCTGEGYLPKFDVRCSKLRDTLVAKVKDRIITDKVESITDTEIVLSEHRERKTYRTLVSTLAAPVFWSKYKGATAKSELDFRPVTLVHSKTPPPNVNGETWDLIYYADPEIPYTRVNRDPTDGTFLYEITGNLDIEEIKRICPEIAIEHRFHDPYGVIRTNQNNVAPRNIRFLGRAAQWDHKLLIRDVIDEAKARRDFVSVWNTQKAFNSKFFDYNVRDPHAKQKLSRDFVLHIADESLEFLQKAHWKGERFIDKPIEKSEILEEWIDIFKYWLGLGNIWGFTIDEFFAAFERKSIEVEGKYSSDDIERIRKSYSIHQVKDNKHASRSKNQDK